MNTHILITTRVLPELLNITFKCIAHFFVTTLLNYSSKFKKIILEK